MNRNIKIGNLKINILDYLGLISLVMIVLNSDKYRLVSSVNWINNLGFNMIYILGALFSLKIIIMVVGDDKNIYLARGKQLFNILSGSLSFTFSYVLIKLVYLENYYCDQVNLKWGIKIKRIWDKNELLNYLNERIIELKSSNLVLDEKYEITMSVIKITKKEINQLVSKNSTIEELNKSLDDLVNKKIDQFKSELENNNSIITQLIDYLGNLPSYYYWIAGLLTIGVGGAACYYLKDQLILRTLIHLKNGLTSTNKGVNEANEAIKETNESIRLLAGKINEVVNETNNNTINIGLLTSQLNKLEGHGGVHQAVLEGLPTDQLKNEEVQDLLKQLLTADNLFTLLDLSELLLGMDGQNFDKLQYLINSINLESESGPRRITRRGNIASFD